MPLVLLLLQPFDLSIDRLVRFLVVKPIHPDLSYRLGTLGSYFRKFISWFNRHFFSGSRRGLDSESHIVISSNGLVFQRCSIALCIVGLSACMWVRSVYFCKGSLSVMGLKKYVWLVICDYRPDHSYTFCLFVIV